MAITSAIADFLKSIAELLSSVFGTAYSIVHSFITGVFGLFSGFFALVGDLGKGVVDLVGGVGKFVASNIVVLGVIAAAGYAYITYVQPQQRQGRKPVGMNGAGAGGKKTN